MSAPSCPPSLTAHIDQYLRDQRRLGRRYRGVASVLRQLTIRLGACGCCDLDATSYAQWCHSMESLHPNTRRKAQQVVRAFSLYRARTAPACFVPSVETFTRPCEYVRPFIIEPHQICRMLSVADELPPGVPESLTPAAARIAVVLLYTAGLRLGELLRLRLDDLRDRGATLYINESKFHRSRFVPLSRSAQRELTGYLAQRTALTRTLRDAGWLVAHRRLGGLSGYSMPGMSALLGRVFARSGIRDAAGRRPRCHDLRHSFAVQSLIRGYRSDADVQSLLPKLAIYMGHASVASTAHYLKLIPAVAALASQRFERHFGQLGTQVTP